MKILYITAEGFDTPNPNNQMAETMIRSFCEVGHSVHLVQSHRKGINPDIPKLLEGMNNLSVDTIVRKIVDKTNFVKRYINDVRYAFSAMKYWKKVKDADVIYLQSNPTIIFSMILLKLFKKKTPIVYSIYDVFPGHAYDIGVIKNKFIYEVLRLIQKPCYKMADSILVQSEDMLDKVVAQSASREKVFIVPAWYDIQTTSEVSWENNRFVKKYNIKSEKFYLQFAGTIGYVFDYVTIIELAKRLIHIPDIVIHIIGDGNVKEQFVQEVERQKLTNVVFFPLQPVEMVSDVYSACNACIIPLKKGVIGNGVPSKAAILMACKRLIINSVEKESAYSKIFIENNMGLSIDIGEYDQLAAAVIDLYNNSGQIERMVENAYNYGKNYYSSDKSIAKILDVFSKTIKDKKVKR